MSCHPRHSDIPILRHGEQKVADDPMLFILTPRVCLLESGRAIHLPFFCSEFACLFLKGNPLVLFTVSDGLYEPVARASTSCPRPSYG
jgi:hypothetical protein